MPQPEKVAVCRCFDSARFLFFLGCVLVVAFSLLPQTARAQRTWYANVGAETKDQAAEANAFLPNEIWINAGDSIQWTWKPQNYLHTVAFLAPGQTRPTPPPPVGPPSSPPGPPFFFGAICSAPNPYAGGSTASYDATACVSSGVLTGSAPAPTFTVTFPKEGNYKLVCLIHFNMYGTVHVLGKNAPLRFLQWDYDRQAQDEAQDILRDTDDPREGARDSRRSQNEVLMLGEVVATPGGRQYLSFTRFFPETMYVHKGDTVEFANADPTEPHTVTSGTGDSLNNDMTRVHVSQQPDGALQGTVNSAADFGDATDTTGLHSGFLQAPSEDAAGRAQAPVFSLAPQQNGLTRIRIQFNTTGTFYYHCALHDVEGMQGKIVVN